MERTARPQSSSSWSHGSARMASPARSGCSSMKTSQAPSAASSAALSVIEDNLPALRTRRAVHRRVYSIQRHTKAKAKALPAPEPLNLLALAQWNRTLSPLICGPPPCSVEAAAASLLLSSATIMGPSASPLPLAFLCLVPVYSAFRCGDTCTRPSRSIPHAKETLAPFFRNEDRAHVHSRLLAASHSRVQCIIGSTATMLAIGREDGVYPLSYFMESRLDNLEWAAVGISPTRLCFVRHVLRLQAASSSEERVSSPLGTGTLMIQGTRRGGSVCYGASALGGATATTRKTPEGLYTYIGHHTT
ncbi:hypothetical protein LXA43DRAFT_58303 [Ganoderma leucocontextum]|nr:hypothetical protein LXA43DRAFT_58303 [Ganoderma leucocontextum]